VVPGLILAVLFVGFVVARCALRPDLAPATAPDRAGGGNPWLALLVHVVPLVLIFAVVVGGIVAGWATPTESGALGAAATILVAALYGKLTVGALHRAFMGALAVSGAVLFILMGALTFSQILTFAGVTNGIVDLARSSGLGPTGLLLAMLALLVFLGCFIDQVSIMMITLPFFMPLVREIGADPVWFGILYLICMQIGLLTPPFGLLLFVMKGAAPPQITLPQVYAAALPYVGFMVLVLALVFLAPGVATWLPGLAR
jgi:tripartite ATP-independent transporter DctM subunit